MKVRLWHKDFIWDGTSFDSQRELLEFVQDHYPNLVLFFQEWLSDSGSIKMKTSGSTGKPKKIILNRMHMMNSAKATGEFFNLGSGSTVLNCLPLGFIAGRMMLVRAMVLGWELDVIEPSSKPEIPENKTFDLTAMVPLQLFNSCDKLTKIDSLIVGGGQVSDVLLRKIAHLNTKIYASYGMTETITHVALSPLNRQADNQNKEEIYTALPEVKLSIDERNCLVIEAPRISTERVITNDIVELVSKDTFKWIARFDHVINSGGIKLIPELIEKRYAQIIQADYFVFGIPDSRLGEKLVLIIEGKKDSSMVSNIRKLESLSDASLVKYEVPKEIIFTDAFVRTATGKVNRFQTADKILSSS